MINIYNSGISMLSTVKEADSQKEYNAFRNQVDIIKNEYLQKITSIKW